MNDIPLSVLFGILAFLLILSAFFSGSETALLKLNRYRLLHLLKKKHKGAGKAHDLLTHPDRVIALSRLGNNLVKILSSSLATLIAIRLGGNETLALGIGLLFITMMIFTEATPTTLATLKPETSAFVSAWIYVPLLKVCYPLVWIINSISNLILRIFGVKLPKKNLEGLNKDQVKDIVTSSENPMPDRYQNMLLSILDLESASVEHIMTHRNDIIGIDLEEPVEDIIKQLQNSPHTRLPVYKKNIDRVIGFLHLRTILSQLTRPDFDKHNITENLSKPFFIPAGTSIQRQMQTFKVEKLRIGLVVDEYGDVLGLLTLDDLLQEIIGELTAEEPAIKLQKDGSYVVDAGVTVRELNRVTQWDLPTEGPKTLNGLIIEYMETIPESGTSIKLHGHALEIIKCDENTVKLVKFYPLM